MTDLIKVAMIASTPPTLAALANIYFQIRSHAGIKQISSEMNGMKDALVKSEKKVSFAEGVAAEKKSNAV